VTRERDDHIPGSEPRVHSTLHCLDAEGRGNPVSGGSQAIVFTGVRDVIHAHGNILALCDRALS
jgi:hypothetical protein